MGAVLLIANYRLDRQQSMARLAELVEEGLRSKGIEVLVIRPEPLFGLLSKAIPRLAKWLGYLDKYLVFPFILAMPTTMRRIGFAMCSSTIRREKPSTVRS